MPCFQDFGTIPARYSGGIGIGALPRRWLAPEGLSRRIGRWLHGTVWRTVGSKLFLIFTSADIFRATIQIRIVKSAEIFSEKNRPSFQYYFSVNIGNDLLSLAELFYFACPYHESVLSLSVIYKDKTDPFKIRNGVVKFFELAVKFHIVLLHWFLIIKTFDIRLNVLCNVFAESKRIHRKKQVF